jgi:hypothetical protein
MADVATAVTRRLPIATYSRGGAGTGFDITQFKDTFVPGDTFSPGYPISRPATISRQRIGLMSRCSCESRAANTLALAI